LEDALAAAEEEAAAETKAIEVEGATELAASTFEDTPPEVPAPSVQPTLEEGEEADEPEPVPDEPVSVVPEPELEPEPVSVEPEPELEPVVGEEEDGEVVVVVEEELDELLLLLPLLLTPGPE